jgi:phosphohistidine swiveling domain-containing protein
MQLPLDIREELFVWGPAKMRIFYCSDWFEAIFSKNHYQKLYPEPEGYWPTSLILCEGHDLIFLGSLAELEKHGGWVFAHRTLDRAGRSSIRALWNEDVRKLELLQAELARTDLTALSDDAFRDWWRRFHQKTIVFWNHGVIPELANYGSIPILKSALARERVPEAALGDVLEALTAPEAPSFYQEEEMELAGTDDIAGHARKYFWIRNNYGHAEVAGEDFFRERKRELSADFAVTVRENIRETRERKAACIKKYSLSKETIDIAAAIVENMEWQDERKGKIFRYIHYKNLLLPEAVRRLGIAREDLLNFREVEIQEMLEGKDLSAELGDRRIAIGFVCSGGYIEFLPSATVREYWNIYAAPKISPTVADFQGIVVSKGKNSVVRGKVRIIRDPYATGDFEEGSVLVTTMTTPEFVFLMKKAAAVVTDAGGLTSHAAIVSRELGVPCIVGTKIATKVLKDGDLVEVDAEQGTVRKL